MSEYLFPVEPWVLQWSESHSVMSDSLQPHGLYIPWNSPGQNTGVGSLCPSPGDLPNPGVEPRSLTLQADFLPAEPQGSPRILEWVAYPFSSGSSQPRNWTRVSCIASGFFTSWAAREAWNLCEETWQKGIRVVEELSCLSAGLMTKRLSWILQMAPI